MNARKSIALNGPASVRRRQRSSNACIIGVMAVAVCLASIAHPFRDASASEFKLLDPLPATKIGPIEKFVAAESFKVGNKIGCRTLSVVGLNFIQQFYGIVERDVTATSLRGWSLLFTLGDRALISALGGEEDAAVSSLAYVYRVMEMADEGPSHTDWRSNFAYVRSPIDRRLWAVHWTVNSANEWNVGAVYVPHPQLDWRMGSRIFGPQPAPLTNSHDTEPQSRRGAED